MHILRLSVLSLVLLALHSCALLPTTPDDADVGTTLNAFIEKHGKFDRFVETPNGGYGLIKGRICVFNGNSLTSVHALTPGEAQFVINFDGYFDATLGTKAKIVHVGDFAKDGDMIAKESARYLKNLLSIKGISTVENVEDSDIIILTSIGMSDPDVRVETLQVPIYGYDGPKTSNTVITGAVNAQATTTTQGQGLYVSGYRQRTVTHVYYTRFVLLKAIDTKKFLADQSQDAVWQIRTLSVGSMGDLRRALPVHYGVILEYFGQNTGEVIKRPINERSFYPTLVTPTRTISGSN